MAGLVSALAARAPALNPVCTANDLIVQDPSNCPNSNAACVIAKSFQVNDGCTLDFGTRNVTINATGALVFHNFTMGLNAGSLTIAPGGAINGTANAATVPGNQGGVVTINATGDVNIQRSAGSLIGVIDVSGNNPMATPTPVFGATPTPTVDAGGGAGAITINAGGNITVSGQLEANLRPNQSQAGGGSIRLTADGNIVLTAGGDISANGGVNSSSGGGEVDLNANGDITLNSGINVNGNGGGTVMINGGGEVAVNTIHADGSGDGTSGDGSIGGEIDINGSTDVVLNGLLSAQGGSPLMQMGSGGCGGTLNVTASFGTLTVVGGIQAEGAQGTQVGGDGAGGSITLCSTGSMLIQKNSPVSARSNGPQGCAGTICVDSGLSLSVQSLLDISGGVGSSEIDICVGTDVTLGQSAGTIIDARGRGADGSGGTVNVQGALVADNGPGTIDIFGTIDSSGDPNSLGTGAGAAGTVVLGACNVKVELSGAIVSRGATGGENDLTGNETIAILGRLDATQIGVNGTAGTNSLEYPSRNPPTLSGIIVPPVGVLVRVAPAAPGTGYVNGDVLNIAGGTGGQATVTQVTNNTITGVEIASPGANYRVNDIILINGGSGGTLVVTAVMNGAVTGLRLTNGGSGYSVSTNQSTNNFGGPGTGFTVNITSVASTGVVGVSLKSGGTGYGSTNGTAVTGGHGTGATLDIVASTTLTADATCTADMPEHCLSPCPTCGNGIVEYPETCDNGTAQNCKPISPGSPTNCTSFCQVEETCDDGDPCTTDTCDPVLGCNYVPIVNCFSPTPTPTITSTPGNTGTPTITGTPTLSPIPSNTPLVPNTPTPTETSTVPAATATKTPTETLVPAQDTRTNTPTPTLTPTPATPADANCDGRITAADISAVVKRLGSTPVCGTDANLDGKVDAADVALTIAKIFGS